MRRIRSLEERIAELEREVRHQKSERQRVMKLWDVALIQDQLRKLGTLSDGSINRPYLGPNEEGR